MRHLGPYFKHGSRTDASGNRLELYIRKQLGMLQQQMRTTGQRFGALRRVLPDGTRVEFIANLNGPNPVLLARVFPATAAEGAEPEILVLFESGLYSVPPDALLYTSATLTHQIYYGDTLAAHFASSGQWQGEFQCNTDTPFSEASPYTSQVQTRSTAKVADKFQPAMYTGLARLLIQAKLAVGKDPQDDLAFGGITLLHKNVLTGTPAWWGDPIGCIQDPGGGYWICHADRTDGLRVQRLAVEDPCPVDLSESEVEAQLRQAYALSTATLTGDVLSLLTGSQISEHVGVDKIVLGHSWHWRRQTVDNASEAAIVAIEEGEGDNGVGGTWDVYTGSIVKITIDWSSVSGSWVPSAEIAVFETGATIRFNPAYHPIWYPNITLNVYQLWCLTGPTGIGSSYDQFSNATTPLYCFYSQEGELEILDYVNFSVYESATEYIRDWSCQSRVGTEWMSGYIEYEGGFVMRGTSYLEYFWDGTSTVDTFDFSKSFFQPKGSQWRRGTASVEVGGLEKFGEGSRQVWFRLPGTMDEEELNSYQTTGALGLPGEYQFFEHWGYASSKLLFNHLLDNGISNPAFKRGCIIPFSDAEAVYLCQEDKFTAGRESRWEFPVESGATLYVQGGETRFFAEDGAGNKGELLHTIHWNTLFSKSQTQGASLSCCSATSGVANPCFPVNATNSANQVLFRLNPVVIDAKWAIFSSAGGAGGTSEEGDWSGFLYGYDCDGGSIFNAVNTDVVGAFNAGGVYIANDFTQEYATLGGYGTAVPIPKARFIGGA